MKQESKPIPLPESKMEFYEPTDPEKQQSQNNHLNIKFKNKDLPEFKGTAEVPVFHEITGELLYEKKRITEGVPNMAFIQKNKLDENSHPADWYVAFIPRSSEKHERLNCSIDT